MKIIITTHSQTIQNTKKICTGHLNGELSEQGIKDANSLGLKFKNKKITVVYSSDLERAKDTAKEILKYYPTLKLKTDKRIRERFFGKLQGKPFPKDLDWKNLPADIETEADMQVRADEFINELKNKHSEETVLIVCHDGIKASLISAIVNKPVLWQDVTKTAVHEFEIK
ncbi:histidine phosphatase family protein [Candidatus Kuenenbacteria bacterium]|nr:histidine phosphatase family protein [Candidatus Kuenenbacteria bacterium]